MARFRTEVRMNLAMSSVWFGDVHHFDDIDVLPFPREGQVPVPGDRRQDDFICGPAWNRPIAAAIPSARYVEVADTGHLPQYEQPVRSGPRCSTGFPPPDYRPDGRPESGAGAEATGSTARGQTFAPDGRSPQMRFPQYRARTALICAAAAAH
jgi:hypothetical protein